MKNLRWFSSSECIGHGRHSDNEEEATEASPLNQGVSTRVESELNISNETDYALSQPFPSSCSTHSKLKSHLRIKSTSEYTSLFCNSSLFLLFLLNKRF